MRDYADTPLQRHESLSGTAYVWVKLRDDPTPKGRVVVRQPSNCDHGTTMCVDCIESWSIDYHVDTRSTAAGRRLGGTN
ncbi:hypothetical protein HWC02_gp027 [Gordonia phage Sombrero]|uniref:Uncharacterized protein n=1 Tax=Gordonia phage Sombrero TaxID=2502420 RepID=A0A411BR25_9CAUD|nr:hypothetical protein HWC02_gp027 [Gordonia phage Sombrero]QAY04064.1 hypothetical protein SEA_SOMBRERO_106 [Gordonia phage Sombrero]